MLTVKRIKELMKDRKIKTVAASIGVHENTLYTFMKSENPRTRTAELLSDYLEGKEVIEPLKGLTQGRIIRIKNET